jgi:Ca2+-binding RTX toxin-like protein
VQQHLTLPASGLHLAVFAIEMLEQRRLLSASVSNGILTVEGTDAGEEITVRAVAGSEPDAPSFTVSVGAEQTTIPATGVHTLIVQAGGGDDTVTVDVPSSLASASFPFAIATVDGGDGNDAVEAQTPLCARLMGGAGDDTLRGGSASDTLRGGPGNDRLEGGSLPDWLYGGPGNDVLYGGDDSNKNIDRDHIRGGAGRDTFSRLDRRSSWLDFGPGDKAPRRESDRARVTFGGDHGEIVRLTGTEEADTFTVYQELVSPDADPADPDSVARFHYSISRGDRVLESGAIESAGKITRIEFQGGGGDDVVDVAGKTFALPSVLGVTPVTVPVTVDGGVGNDRIYGGLGDDRLSGNFGDDEVDGGGGNDALGAVYLGGHGPNLGSGFYLGEQGNDRLTGGDGDDVISAGEGNDVVTGGAGDDKLWGGEDADEIRGEDGSDTFYASDDAAELRDRTPEEAVEDLFESTRPGEPLIARVEDGVLVLRGTDAAEGIHLSQRTRGTAVDFYYAVDRGVDASFFGALPTSGGITAVRIEAGGGDDAIQLSSWATGAGSGGVTIPSQLFGGDGKDFILGGHAADEVHGGAGDDHVLGAKGKDALFGEAGVDELSGGWDDDTLSGGAGADRLEGDFGHDTFDSSDDPSEYLDRRPDDLVAPIVTIPPP